MTTIEHTTGGTIYYVDGRKVLWIDNNGVSHWYNRGIWVNEITPLPPKPTTANNTQDKKEE